MSELNFERSNLTNHYIKSDLIRELEEGLSAIEEAKELIQINTVDSYLRYFQTCVFDGKHIPTVLLNNSKTVQRLLAKKLEPIIKELGFQWEEDALLKRGELNLQYRRGEYSLNFAYFNPYERTLVFKFDIEEMERERDINVHKIRQKKRESQDRLLSTKVYLEKTTGNFWRRLLNFRNKKMIERLEKSIGDISGELDELEEELKNLTNNKILLETIKAKLPEMEKEFTKYGITIQFVKGEIYEV